MELGFSHLKKIECIKNTVLSRIPRSLGRPNSRWEDDIKVNSTEIMALVRIISLGLHEASS